MIYGYQGQILIVDLSKREILIRPLKEEYIFRHIGGRALAARILYEYVKPNIDPLGPENALIWTVGPLNGTASLQSGKMNISTKSPLTNGYLDCSMGGFLGSEIKFAGYDSIVIKGSSPEPVYLKITNDKVELLRAENIWGLSVFDAEKTLKRELGQEYKIASIGPAGENRVKYSCICHNLYRQAGRGGAGAVMGAKNLKAIAIYGSGCVEIADKKKFERVNGEMFSEIIKKRRSSGDAWVDSIVRYGTPTFLAVTNEHGILPTRNFQATIFENASEIDGEALRQKIYKKDAACTACALGCGKLVQIPDGPYKGTLVGPEYETIFALGSDIGIGDIKAIGKFNELCDGYGLDTISTGVVIGFAMECYEKGILTKKDVDGLELKFGNEEVVLELIKKVATKDGIGALMSEGVRKMSEEISGNMTRPFAMHVKGLELPGYDPRGAHGMALAYAISDRGGCHTRAWPIRFEIYGNLDPFGFEGKAELVKVQTQRKVIMDSLVICDMLGINSKYGEVLEAVTGLDVEVKMSERYPTLVEEFIIKGIGKESKVGESHINIARAFNVREGFDRKDDTLPKRLFTETPVSGPAKGHLVDEEKFNDMLDEYYRFVGWDKNGRLTKTKVEELGLTDLLGDII
jgi:aldehyde:ferredoxin oxidoreductase